MKNGKKIISRNKKAYHNYHILDTYEAGLVLMGSEIKSIRANRISLGDGYAQERNGELWLIGVHIGLYDQAKLFGHQDPLRPRKLLLHKREISRIINQIQQKGFSAIPTMIYLVNGRAKVEIGLAKGKKLYDKRESISKRDAKRQIERTLKGNY
jgi:SsrA-binding protein